MTTPAADHTRRGIAVTLMAAAVIAVSISQVSRLATAAQPEFPGGLGPINHLWAPAESESLDGVIADVLAAPVPATAVGAFDRLDSRREPHRREVVRANEIRLHVPPYGGQLTGSATVGWWTVWSGDAVCNTTTNVTFEIHASYDQPAGIISGSFDPTEVNEILPGCELERVAFSDRFHSGSWSGKVDVQTGRVTGSLGRGMEFTAAADPAQLAGAVPAPLRLRRAMVGSKGLLAWVALTFEEPWPPRTPLDDVVVGVVFATTGGGVSAGFRVDGGVTRYFSGTSDALAWFATTDGTLIGVAEVDDALSESTPPTIVVYGRQGPSISEVRRFTAEEAPMLSGFVGSPLDVLDDVPIVDMANLEAYWAEGTVLTAEDLNPPPPTTVALPPPPVDVGPGFAWRWPAAAAAAAAVTGGLVWWWSRRGRATRR